MAEDLNPVPTNGASAPRAAACSRSTHWSATIRHGGTTTMLSVEEERELVEAWCSTRDRRALGTLCLRFEPLIRNLAARASLSMVEVDREDLFQEAREAFIMCLDKFDPNLGYRLGTYAASRIVHHIRHARALTTDLINFRKNTRLRLASTRMPELLRQARMIEGDHVSFETRQRIAAESNITYEEMRWLECRLSPHDVSLSNPFSQGADGGDGQDAFDALSLVDPGPSPETAALHTEARRKRAALIALLNSLLAELSDRDRDIVVRLHLSEVPATLQVMGDLYGISRERVRQISMRSLDILRQRLEESGIRNDAMAFDAVD